MEHFINGSQHIANTFYSWQPQFPCQYRHSSQAWNNPGQAFWWPLRTTLVTKAKKIIVLFSTVSSRWLLTGLVALSTLTVAQHSLFSQTFIILTIPSVVALQFGLGFSLFLLPFVPPNLFSCNSSVTSKPEVRRNNLAYVKTLTVAFLGSCRSLNLKQRLDTSVQQGEVALVFCQCFVVSLLLRDQLRALWSF